MGIVKVVVVVGVGDTEGPEKEVEVEVEGAVMGCVVSTTTVPAPDSRRRKRRIFPKIPEPAVSIVVVRVPWV